MTNLYERTKLLTQPLFFFFYSLCKLSHTTINNFHTLIKLYQGHHVKIITWKRAHYVSELSKQYYKGQTKSLSLYKYAHTSLSSSQTQNTNLNHSLSHHHHHFPSHTPKQEN